MSATVTISSSCTAIEFETAMRQLFPQSTVEFIGRELVLSTGKFVGVEDNTILYDSDVESIIGSDMTIEQYVSLYGISDDAEAEVRGSVAQWLLDVADGDDAAVVRRGVVASWEGSAFLLALALERFDAAVA